MRECGITPPEPERAATWSRIDKRTKTHRELVTLAQPAIGAPGTRIRGDGVIDIEHNPKLVPTLARGYMGRPGLHEEMYRTEPIVFKSVNEISSLVCHASYEPHIPDGTPADVATEIERQHGAILRAMRKDDFLVNAATFVKHGFAFFEVLWETSDPVPAGLEFREQSTVHAWLFDDRQSRHLATEFRTSGQTNETYVIPNGDTLRSARTLLVQLHATGNNIEGVSPCRLVVGLRKLKELVLQSFGVSYQRFAVPIAIIAHEVVEASNILSDIGTAEHKAEVQELIGRIEAMRSRLPSVIPLPEGRSIRWENPSSDMPDPKPMLDYIDMMMALVFANEGALLGSQSFGSYAMAKTSDEKFMRAAPMYAGRVASALTTLLLKGLALNGIETSELERLPRYTFRFEGTQDTSRWLEDLTKVMNANPASWPDEVRHSAASRLGLPETALDDIEERGSRDAIGPNNEGDADDVQKTALNGAQVTSMVEVLTQVASKQLPAESAIRILMRAFQMTREEAAAMVSPSEGFEQAQPSALDERVRAPFGEEEE